MRWETAAREAAARQGLEVVDVAGVDDWQGWGVLLLKGDVTWGVCAWSYGSCSYCDAYEDLSDSDLAAAFDRNITLYSTEDEARAKFEDAKGW